MHDFNDNQIDEHQAFYMFNLKREIKCDNETFVVSVSQQGDRLATYHFNDRFKAFKPTEFNIMLIKEESGKFI